MDARVEDAEPDVSQVDTRDGAAEDTHDVSPAMVEVAAPDAASDATDTAEVDSDGGQPVAERCFPAVDRDTPGPVWDQLGPVVGSHRRGTDHQDIASSEALVFLGDPVTVLTPNLAHLLRSDDGHFYRNLLAEWLAARLGLDRGDAITRGSWMAHDYLRGECRVRVAGSFGNCARWALAPTPCSRAADSSRSASPRAAAPGARWSSSPSTATV